MYRSLNSPFHDKTFLLKPLIMFDDEADINIKFYHENLIHIGGEDFSVLKERRNLYINKLTEKIKKVVKNCNLFTLHKLIKFIKSQNIQILSKYPLEHVKQI